MHVAICSLQKYVEDLVAIDPADPAQPEELCGLDGGVLSSTKGLLSSESNPPPAGGYANIIIATDIPKLNFGKNAALSGDGNWVAVSEDYVGGLFVFGRWGVTAETL